MEQEIKRVNFYDGQFLKQEEFLEEQEYHKHMRRRMNYVLFERTGVLQLGATDLNIVRVDQTDPNNKRFFISAGAALHLNSDTMEGIEIIQRQDSEVYSPADFGLSDTDTGWVSIRYCREETTGGDEPGPTRVLEKAEIRVDISIAAVADPPYNEAYVILGSINFNNMGIDPGDREVTRLRAAIIGQAPGIIIDPTNVPAGTSKFRLRITGTGALDLSTLDENDVTFVPSTGINFVSVISNNGTTMEVEYNIDGLIPPGNRTVTVTGATDPATLTITPGLAITGFIPSGVEDTHFTLTGTGLTDSLSVAVQFSGTTTEVSGEVSGTTQVRIPIDDIPEGAGSGTVTVTHGGDILTSSPNITPPPRIESLEHYPSGSSTPDSDFNFRPGDSLKINGVRFIGDVNIHFPDGSDIQVIETSHTTTTIVKQTPAAIGDGTVEVQTSGGTAQSAASINMYSS